MNDLDIVYQLEDSRSPMSKGKIYLIVGGICLVLGFIFSGILSFILWGVGLIALGIFAANYFSTDSPITILTRDKIISKTKAGEKSLFLSEITKAEVNITENGRIKKINIFEVDTFSADEKSMLSIVDTDNKRLEVRAEHYNLSDFISFLDVFKVEGKQSRLVTHHSYDSLIAQNNTFLQNDYKLKEELDKTLMEAYKALYNERGEMYIKNNPDSKILFEYRKNQMDMGVYFLDNDYQDGLQIADIEGGKVLIQNAQKNLKVVDTRIAYYKQIAGKLLQMKSAFEARMKMNKITAKLDNLQDQNNVQKEASDEYNLQVETLKQLEELTLEVHSLDMLEKTTLLQEKAAILGESR
ncbi:MAG: hypothetical protein MUE81_13005 [Thermoflexibacter sp.]|jgi:hypothetical protein|nr:hypothetical protein [Thermoflexibacter sp.]